MPAAIKQIVTVRPGGVVEVRSPELREGDQAEVTIVVKQAVVPTRAPTRAGSWRQYAGSFDSHSADAGDNQRIDADLAREYGDESKPES